MTNITSRDNKILKLARSLKSKKARQENGLYFVEGKIMCQEAIDFLPDHIYAVLVSDNFEEKNEAFIKKLDESGKQIYTMRENLFEEVCDTETPQGIGVIVKMSQKELKIEDCSLLLALDGVSEPGNLGTIVRTAEAADVDGIILFKGCADLYNPKVVRSTMGSLFRMPCMTGISPDFLKECKENGYYITATALKNSVSIREAVKKEKQIIVIGSEANGVSDEVLNYSDQRVSIPMAGKVESLNASVAAGIAMYIFNDI